MGSLRNSIGSQQAKQTVLWICVVFSFAFAAGYLFISHNLMLLYQQKRLLALATQSDFPTTVSDQNDFISLQRRALGRALIYHNLILESHLDHDMIINRNYKGQPEDRCDSLLFSSLRYVALKKLGLDEHAKSAWNAIKKSNSRGFWRRHPQCSLFASRDMILGLLVALTQRPQDHQQIIESLVAQIDENSGYFSHGPFYVSSVSPNLLESIKIMAVASNAYPIPGALPRIFQFGFTTSEWSALVAERGYQAHLLALNVWLELEMADASLDAAIHAPTTLLSSLKNVYGGNLHMEENRLQWITSQLYALDRHNLFFKWLWLRASGLLNQRTKYLLLKELVEHPAFPPARLPQSCDRKADYLWQRDSNEYFKRSARCNYQFNGVDFLWLAGLLLEKDIIVNTKNNN